MPPHLIPLAYLKAETDVNTASRSGARKYLELAEVDKVELGATRPRLPFRSDAKKVPAGLTNHHNCFVSLAVYKLVLLLVDAVGVAPRLLPGAGPADPHEDGGNPPAANEEEFLSVSLVKALALRLISRVSHICRSFQKASCF